MAEAHQKTILLVEDELLIAMAEQATLERAGYAVITAKSGERAVEIARSNPAIDLVLMDINLGGGMDGTEAAEIIVSACDLPLVFLSSHTEPDIVDRTEGITSYGYIVKNSGDTVLLASIRMAFRLHEANRSIAGQRRRMAAASAELEWWPRLMEYVIENDLTAIAILDRNLRFMYVSRSFVQDYGAVGQSVIGRHHYEVFPEIPQRWRDAHRRALHGETLSSDDDLFERSDGTVVYTRWECRPWYETTGTVGGIILYTEVLTEQKQLEKALRDTEYRFRSIMDSMHDIVFTVDADKRHTGVYGPWVAESGLTQQHFLGKTFSEILGASAATVHEQACDRALAGEFAVYQWSVASPEGVKHYQTSLSPIRVADGPVSGVVGIGRDITALKDAEAVAQRERLLLNSIVDTVPVMITRYDPEIQVLYLNSEFTRKIGWSTDDARGVDLMREVYPDAAYRKQARDYMERAVPEWREFELRTRTGEMIVSRWSNIRLDDGTQVGVGIDVTDARNAEERFRILMEGVDAVAVQSYGPDGTTRYWNRASERLYGYSAAEATGRNVLDLIIPPETRDLVEQEIRSMNETGQATPASELTLARKDGTRVQVFANHAVVHVPGYGLELFCLDIDLTEQKRAEVSLSEQKHYLETVLQTSADGFWVVDRDGRLVEANETFCRMTGYSRGELLSLSIGDIDVEETPEETAARIRRIIRNGREVFETRQRRRGGGDFDVEISASFLPENGGRIVCFGRDVTERNEAERILRESSDRFRGLLDGIRAVAVQGYGPDGTIRYWNLASEQLYGYRAAEAVGRNVIDLIVPSELRATVRQRIGLMVESGQPIPPSEDWLTRKDGTRVRVLTSHAVVHLPAGEMEVFSVDLDVTDQRLAEEEVRELAREKETLLKEVQHRVKNTMNTMVSLLSLQAGAVHDPEAVAALNDATSRLRSMEVLYDQLYRTETHDHGSVDTYLANLVRDLVALFPGGENVRVTTEMDEYDLDAKRLSTLGMIVSELVTNAMKYAFSDFADGRLAVAVRRDRDRMTVSVEDNGPGLPEVSGTDAPSGFGMTMAFALAGQLDGTLRFESDGGTRAVLEFPLA